jgi:drug/metabolite transporter (DMT)-like permease
VVRGVLLALAAAASFGVTIPLVQLAQSPAFGGRGAHEVGAFWTAALLYVGAAIGAFPSRKPDREARLRSSDAARLVIVAILGAVIAPLALAWGLKHASGSSASLLLTLEAAFTIALGRLLYREHVGRRVTIAAALIGAGAVALVFERGALRAEGIGLVAIAVATLGWALDNALARPLADRDPGSVVLGKSLLGASLSLAIAFVVTPDARPPIRVAVALIGCGALGFGMSLRLYLRAQRALGAARTASVFAFAPFVGAIVATVLGAAPTPALALAAVLMSVGVWLHATERHAHAHAHEPLTHEHAHRHDDGHHDHVHDPMPRGEHSHAHSHAAVTHSHEHADDQHHRHH